MLPGQRAGAQLWYESITELLGRELSMKQCDAYPNLLVTEDRRCTILLHVDDMMVCGHGKYVDEVLIPTLKRFHRISSEFIRNVGDEICFLKRTHRWIDAERLTITPHHKHVEQLMKLTGVRSTTKPKRVPGHPLMEEPDDTDQLEAVETGEYRSCVGILLYFANDLPHCQHAIRHLSTGMSKPTKRLKDILRHLVSYLSGTKDVGLALQFKGDNVGVHHQYLENPDVWHLVFSDSDWASNKSHRRSISSGYLCCGSALLYSSSRTQKVVALSSGEAEVYAASSSACDSVLLARILNYATGMSIMVHHLMDSAAARGILRRQGVGRIRHLSCRILWLQELVKCSRVFKKETDPDFSPLAHDVAAVSGAKNLADLGTKRLGKQRLVELMGFCNMGTIEGDVFTPFHQDSVADASSNVISLVKSLRHHGSTNRQAEVALQVAQIALLQSVLSPVPTMGMGMDGDAYSCVLPTTDGGVQWSEYFPYFFVGIFILATMAWIAYTVTSSARTSRGRKFPKGKELYSKERICL